MHEHQRLDRRRGQAGTENHWPATEKNNRETLRPAKQDTERPRLKDRIVTDYSTPEKKQFFHGRTTRG
jgi:hypothetical protein